MRKSIIAASLVVLSYASTGAVAGEFSVSCNYKNDNIQECASVISDLVTDKFVSKFSAANYQIFLYSNIHSFSDGGFSAYSTSGVVARGSSDFPRRYYTNASINGTGRKYTAVELAQIELKVYRAAAKALMDACEISPQCDVYVANGGK